MSQTLPAALAAVLPPGGGTGPDGWKGAAGAGAGAVAAVAGVPDFCRRKCVSPPGGCRQGDPR